MNQPIDNRRLLPVRFCALPGAGPSTRPGVVWTDRISAAAAPPSLSRRVIIIDGEGMSLQSIKQSLTINQPPNSRAGRDAPAAGPEAGGQDAGAARPPERRGRLDWRRGAHAAVAAALRLVGYVATCDGIHSFDRWMIGMAKANNGRRRELTRLLPPPRHTRTVRSLASVGALLDQITYEIPLKEALQYPKGKEKWTRADLKVREGYILPSMVCFAAAAAAPTALILTHLLDRSPTRPPPPQLAADGLAAGFLDLGFQPGDTIAAWLPKDDVDLHVTQFGAAKAGLTLAVLDEGITKEGLARTLADTNAKALIYTPYRGNTDNTAVLQSLIPELSSCESESEAIDRSSSGTLAPIVSYVLSWNGRNACVSVCVHVGTKPYTLIPPPPPLPKQTNLTRRRRYGRALPLGHLPAPPPPHPHGLRRDRRRGEPQAHLPPPRARAGQAGRRAGGRRLS